MKILHIVSNMRHGGVQSWVMGLMRAGAADGIQMDVLTYSNEAWPFTAEIESLGGHVFRCVNHRNPLALHQVLKTIVREHGPYDAIHSHEMFHNGVALTIGRFLRIPVRVSHAHNSAQAVRPTQIRRAYNWAMRYMLRLSATNLLAVSDMAGQTLYGQGWRKNRRSGVVSCGLDFRAIVAGHDRDGVRRTFDIPPDAVVIGHVGRFVHQKNHEFLVDVAAAAMKLDPRVRLMMIGAGALEPEIRTKVERLGIAGRTIFTGARDDAAQMMAAFDVFVLPSRFEGLGLVILEALAAGKPCLISDVVPPEIDIDESMILKHSLNDPSEDWAVTALSLGNEAPIKVQDGLLLVERSDFSLSTSYSTMKCTYSKSDNLS